MKKKHVSRLSYAAGAFGNDVFYATLSTYFIVFVTTHLFNASDHKMIFIITNLIAAIRIGEVLIDPLIGNAIDRTGKPVGEVQALGCGRGDHQLISPLSPLYRLWRP